MAKGYAVTELEAAADLAEVIPAAVDVPRFLACCQACPNYGRHWSCPPYDMDPLSVWTRYHHLLLLARVVTPGPELTVEEGLAALERERDALTDAALAREGDFPGGYSLGAGPCARCGKRCMRALGKLCRFPQKRRPSIESLGGDVSWLTQRYWGKSLLWVREDRLPEYFLLVAGVLH